jgi:hypothetical protein
MWKLYGYFALAVALSALTGSLSTFMAQGFAGYAYQHGANISE